MQGFSFAILGVLGGKATEAKLPGHEDVDLPIHFDLPARFKRLLIPLKDTNAGMSIQSGKAIIE